MLQPPGELHPHALDVLRNGARMIALRALGDVQAAEDVAQETVARVLAALREGRLRDHDKLAAFAHSTARHVIGDELRNRRRAGPPVLAEQGDAAGVLDDPLDRLVRAEAEQRMHRALAKLSPRDRELLRLAFFEGLKPAHMAERLGEPVTRIRMRKSRALERLRRVFLESGRPRYELPITATTRDEPAAPSDPDTGGARP